MSARSPLAQPDDLIAFIEMHWPEFDAESIAASRL